MILLLAPSFVGMAVATAAGYSSLTWLIGAGIAGQLLIIVSPLAWFFIEANSLPLTIASLAYMAWSFYGTARFSMLFLVGAAALMVAQSASVANPQSFSSVYHYFFNKMNANGQLGPLTDAIATRGAQGPGDYGWQGAR